MIRVLFICHGNICRSTLAESVFTHKVNSLGLAHNFEIDSFATSREEIGNDVYPPARAELRALRLGKTDCVIPTFAEALEALGGRVPLLLEIKRGHDNRRLCALTGRDIADPWYTGDFEATYRDVVEGCNGFLVYLRREGKI